MMKSPKVNPESLLRKFTSMQDFGPVRGLLREVRVDRLENRRHSIVAFPHKHNFFQLMLILKGSGWHEIDFSRYAISSKQLFFTKLGQIHCWHMSAKTSGYIIEFTSETIAHNSTLICPSWSVGKISDQIEFKGVSATIHRHISNLFELMYEEYQNERADFETALRHYLIPMLIDLHRLSNGKIVNPRDTDPLLDLFLSLVEENFATNRGLIFYSRKLKVTPKALTMRVSRALGKPARAVIFNRCLLEAKRLLGYSNINISEVGHELGFEDPNYFARFFKNAEGISPGKFRAKAMRTNREETDSFLAIEAIDAL
jgi:AraC family transcriptional regulator, transcriptional activator of pobA